MKRTQKEPRGSFFISTPQTKQWQSLARGVSFSKIKEAVLGKRYSLSVVFISPQKMMRLNRSYRHTQTSTDILSFPLSKTEGEIYISMPDVKKKAKVFAMKEADYFKYLYIHGLVHLRGLDHGKKMDAEEKKYCRRFNFVFPE